MEVYNKNTVIINYPQIIGRQINEILNDLPHCHMQQYYQMDGEAREYPKRCLLESFQYHTRDI